MIQLAGEGPLTYLAASVAGLALPDSSPGTERLENQFGMADYGPTGVAALPQSLQTVTVREPGDFDFGLLTHLPLETARSERLRRRTAGMRHPDHSGGRRPVRRLAPLPNLRVLDVSKAEVDVESLPQVDYLVLNASQWRRCSMTPAAATLTGESSLARALVWEGERGVELPRDVTRGRVASA